MFERFTDRARRVVTLAQEEARLFKHNYIGTEHILLALVGEGEGVGAQALDSMGLEAGRIRQRVAELVTEGDRSPSGHIPFTPRAKKVLELSLREALQLGHNYIGTEHILLGLIREGEGIAAKALVQLGADLSQIRQTTMKILSGYEGVRTDTTTAEPEDLEGYLGRLQERAEEYRAHHQGNLFEALLLSQQLNDVLVQELTSARERIIQLERIQLEAQTGHEPPPTATD